MRDPNNKKMWSGRFILCVCAAISLMMFSVVVAYLMVKTEDKNGLTIALNMIGNVIVSIVTFYFTKNMANTIPTS